MFTFAWVIIVIKTTSEELGNKVADINALINKVK